VHVTKHTEALPLGNAVLAFCDLPGGIFLKHDKMLVVKFDNFKLIFIHTNLILHILMFVICILFPSKHEPHQINHVHRVREAFIRDTSRRMSKPAFAAAGSTLTFPLVGQSPESSSHGGADGIQLPLLAILALYNSRQKWPLGGLWEARIFAMYSFVHPTQREEAITQARNDVCGEENLYVTINGASVKVNFKQLFKLCFNALGLYTKAF
jgi:hypothetical protein